MRSWSASTIGRYSASSTSSGFRRGFRSPPARNRFTASSTSVCSSTGSGATGSVPVSMRATSRRSPIRWRIWSDWSRMMRWNWAISEGCSSPAASSSVSTDPLTAARGVLSSWLTMARNSARSRSCSSRGVRSCRVMTKDSIPPSSPWMGVAFSRARTLGPIGDPQHDLLGPHRLPGPQGLGQGQFPQRYLPAVRAHAGHHLQQVLSRLLPLPEAVHDAPDFPVHRQWRPGPGVEDRHAHRRGVDQSFQVGPGPAAPPGACGRWR